ncbi:MAG: acetolactate synthase small subunit [Paramuribaculum sp.]|nr:acetolactate synthase small subunit [Paramuribaculum sp.]
MDKNEEGKRLYTITVFTENHVGLMNQLSIIFTRRNLNLESVSASPCSIPGVHKMTLTCYSDRETLEPVIKQIEKRVEVLKAFLFTNDELIYQEVALYKVPTARLLDSENLEAIIRRHNARILEITRDNTVLEKTGHSNETEALFEELKKYDIRQFVRSGRVAVTRANVELVDQFIREQEERRNRIDGR